MRSLAEGNRRDLLVAAAALAGATATREAAAAPPSVGGNPAGQVRTPPEAVVEAGGGKLRGYVRNGIYTFKGIPYGDTTAGMNRFMAPRRAPAWTGVRSALSWGPVCPQQARAARRNDEEQFLMQWDDGFHGEDMLNANVWTPAVRDQRKRAVMVWIHGGSFTFGSSHELPCFDGESLARRGDVVVVSLNHRLNAFGFLDLSAWGGPAYAQSGNCGMLDLVLALQWVRDNAAAFGGDSSNVTIFGQSGGAAKVNTLMAMPSAKGLFHRAILHSGSTVRVATSGYAQRLAKAVLDELDIPTSRLSRINDVPFGRLLAAGIAGSAKLGFAVPEDVGRAGFQPVVDGIVLPAHPFDPGAPSVSAHVPMMVGSALDEGSPSKSNPRLEDISEADVRRRISDHWNGKDAALYDAWKSTRPNAKPVEILGWATWPQNVISYAHAERRAALKAAPVYHYKFNWHTPLLDGRPRSFHCSELPFAFYNIDTCENWTGNSEEAWALAAKISDAWTSFAKTGNPNHAGLPHWPPFANGETMTFNTRCAVQIDPDGAGRRAQAPLILGSQGSA